MIILDTTVLVYAMGENHEFRQPCRDLIAAIATGTVEATTTVEVIQEFVHVRSRRRGRDDAATLGREYLDLLTPLLAVSATDLRSGLALFESVSGLGAFDAVLAGAVIGAGASALVSADRAFGAVAGLAHVVPDATGIAGLIAT